MQQVLLGMMDDIDSFCRDTGLHYVMSGGCALGAVRYSGFIPWDDDIDLCMPRCDYDRFRELFLQQFADKYDVQEVRVCEYYDLNFTKIRLKGSVFREPLDPEPERAGIFIDLFPIENTANNALLRKMQQILSDGMQFICSCVRIHKKKELLLGLAGNAEGGTRVIRIKAAIGRCFSFISFRRWLLWTERVLSMCHNENSHYIAIPTGGKHFKGETYPRECFFPEERMDFAGHSYCRIHDIENYLQQMYGTDWMTPPPEDERQYHVLAAFALPDEEEN